VYEVTIVAETGYVVVQYTTGDWRHSSDAVGYQIGTHVPAHAMVTGMTHRHGWTAACASWDYIALNLAGNAVALRFDWHDWGGSTVVPADSPVVGESGCIGDRVIAEIDRLRAFDAFALFADGSEQLLGRSSLKGGDPARLPVELAPHLQLDPTPKPRVRAIPTYEAELATFVDDTSKDRRALVAYGMLLMLLAVTHLPVRWLR
jgi:hypothetical protein